MNIPIFEGFALVELMGRRQLSGMCREIDMLGTRVLRIDVALPEGESPQTSFYPVGGIFGIHPIADEDSAREADANLRTLRQMALRSWPKVAYDLAQPGSDHTVRSIRYVGDVEYEYDDEEPEF